MDSTWRDIFIFGGFALVIFLVENTENSKLIKAQKMFLLETRAKWCVVNDTQANNWASDFSHYFNNLKWVLFTVRWTATVLKIFGFKLCMHFLELSEMCIIKLFDLILVWSYISLSLIRQHIIQMEI